MIVSVLHIIVWVFFRYDSNLYSYKFALSKIKKKEKKKLNRVFVKKILIETKKQLKS